MEVGSEFVHVFVEGGLVEEGIPPVGFGGGVVGVVVVVVVVIGGGGVGGGGGGG